MRHAFKALVAALFFPLTALAHGPDAVPDAPELRRQYGEAFQAYQKGDYVTARTKWLPLAEGGSSAAQLFVGFIYDNGQGVAKDDAAAAAWYRESAERGNMVAQIRLALMYRAGRGVPQDRVQAWVWAGMAARKEDHMHRIGRSLQRELAEVMTSDERAEAERLLGERAAQH